MGMSQEVRANYNQLDLLRQLHAVSLQRPTHETTLTWSNGFRGEEGRERFQGRILRRLVLDGMVAWS
jgi:hypothetical protein